jgi:hypothetical protein
MINSEKGDVAESEEKVKRKANPRTPDIGGILLYMFIYTQENGLFFSS